ncbi:MAG TPA: TIGR02594 family protein [Gemmatimonadaceae bacterium]|nr:TIGR02594 family protein [Gemmatimonadaceae bacterium]
MATLQVGDRGSTVTRLQELLNQQLAPSPGVTVDGDFGPRTRAAVLRFQQLRGLAGTGIVTDETWRALDPSGAAATTRDDPTLPVAMRRDWMEVARAELGVHERRGGDHEARIVEYHRSTTLRATDDETPWCASFVNWVLLQAGYRGTNSARARDWLAWGRPIETPREGAVTVLRRKEGGGHDASTGSSSGWHVAFYAGGDAGTVRLLGGNQGNQVKYSTYSLDRYEVRGYRWPE